MTHAAELQGNARLPNLMHDNEEVLVVGHSYRALRVQKLANLHCKHGTVDLGVAFGPNLE